MANPGQYSYNCNDNIKAHTCRIAKVSTFKVVSIYAALVYYMEIIGSCTTFVSFHFLKIFLILGTCIWYYFSILSGFVSNIFVAVGY